MAATADRRTVASLWSDLRVPCRTGLTRTAEAALGAL